MPTLADLTSYLDQQSGRSLADVAGGRSASDIYRGYANPEAVLASPLAGFGGGVGLSALGRALGKSAIQTELGPVMSAGKRAIGQPYPEMEKMVEEYLRRGGRDLNQIASDIA